MYMSSSRRVRQPSEVGVQVSVVTCSALRPPRLASQRDPLLCEGVRRENDTTKCCRLLLRQRKAIGSVGTAAAGAESERHVGGSGTSPRY